ncbi:type II toxin-antitoxin system YoeB family toxin [Kineococcus sp. GCM10028916]|uniref:type II toxin-antitoxin system YoeB family toxin n=1 Tax=Kineococcus sp. GCM10028916 TaxID=3273394 RepID=UPI0036341CA3
MIEESWRDAGQGIGKLEQLSGDLAGLLSRRITDKHRLVYEVVDGAAVVHQA